MNFKNIVEKIDKGDFNQALKFIKQSNHDFETLMLEPYIMIKKSKYEEARDLLNRLNNIQNKSIFDKYIFETILTRLDYRQYAHGNIIDKFDQLQNYIDQLENDKFILCFYKFVDFETRGFYHHLQGNLIEAQKLYKIAISHANNCNLYGSSSNVYLSWGEIFEDLGDLDNALKTFNDAIQVLCKINDYSGLGHAYLYRGIIYQKKGFLNQALESLKLSNNNFEKSDIPSDVNKTKFVIGTVMLLQGKIDTAIDLFKQTLEYSISNNFKFQTAEAYHYLGSSYERKLQFDKALENLKISYNIWKEIGNNIERSHVTYHIVSVYTYLDDLNKAREYVKKLEEIKNESDSELVTIRLDMSRAVIHKKIPRIKSKVIAQQLYDSILQRVEIDFETKIIAMINLSELKLFETKSSDDPEILEEVKTLIKQIFDLSQQQESDLFKIEAMILQIKLSQLNYEYDKCFNILEQAEIIARNKGLEHLLEKLQKIKIAILDELEKINEMRGIRATLTDRINTIKINEYLAELREFLKSN